MEESTNNNDDLDQTSKDQGGEVNHESQQGEGNSLYSSSLTVGDLLQRLNVSGQLLASFDKVLSKSVQRITEQVNETIRQSLLNITNKIFETFHPFQEFAEYLKEFHEKYKITENQAVKILRKYRWFFSPSMPFTFVAKVVEVGNKKGNQRGAVNALFVGYYSQNNYRQLVELVNSWSSNHLFKPRMKILRDCVKTLKLTQGNFNSANVILPTLIAQLDGILTDYTAKHQRDPQFKNQFRQLTQGEYQPELVNDVLLELLFQRAIPGQQLAVPFIFNRHKIMHGEYTRYGRMEHVIRAFLLLDFLAHLP